MCFLIHTLMGLIIAGFFPSLAATYATIRTWFLDDDDRWTWRTAWTVFHDVWKTDCGAANLFGWMQVMIGLFLGWDYYLVQTHNFGHLFTVAVSGVLLVVNMFYWLFAIMSWLIRAHFQENTWRIVRMSIAMSIARPLSSVCIIVFFAITLWVWMHWPGIFMTFGIIVPLYVCIAAIYTFAKIPGFSGGVSSSLTDLAGLADLCRFFGCMCVEAVSVAC
ncbi:hypothetical protein HMPREF2909_00535 [Alloscardovia sp. HMSC034E08]|nr:hypothetical protein HMPREF2909_00535 [Alloscardovia sp. HMSC034E08]